jgi:hypothetical protein
MNNDDRKSENPPQISKIRHSTSSLSSGSRQDAESVPVARPLGAQLGGSKITTFGKETRHEESWSRTPNTTGAGAIHVKTFHSKLTDDALVYMDQAINEWLDAHPQYEVKFVTSTVGILTGKSQEPHLICQVWV